MDFYQLLGISETANEAEIKIAFRRLAKIYHPDVNRNAEAGDRFRILYIAYETLINPARRKLYDQLHLEEIKIHTVPQSRAYYEKMQRRASMRARMYASMQYDKFEESAFSNVSFHLKQTMAFIFFFALMCGGMISLNTAFHYLFYESFNGSQVTGYVFVLIGVVFCYISGKALLGIYEAWRLGGMD